METTKVAYKGFKKDLSCLNEKFEVGVIYSKENPKEKPKLCSNDGWHYCDKLEHVYAHYPVSQGHRFFEIEVLGNVTSDGSKSITTSFKILKEITDEVYKKRRPKPAFR